jgi:hypothetical protein
MFNFEGLVKKIANAEDELNEEFERFSLLKAQILFLKNLEIVLSATPNYQNEICLEYK